MRRAAPLAFAALLAAATAAWAAETLAPPNLPSPDTWVPTAGGQIRILDKQKAQSRLLALKVGETVHVETLSITLRACMVRPPVLPPDAAGFLEISDSREGEPGFHGWMLAHEPGVAMLESPVYGIRVAGCEKPTDAAIAAAMPPPPAPKTDAASPPDATTRGGAPAAGGTPGGAPHAPPAPSVEPPMPSGQDLGGGDEAPPPPAPASPASPDAPPQDRP